MLGVRIIADHQGGMKGSSSLPEGRPMLSQPGLASLLSLAVSKHVVIKLSGFYRSSASNGTIFSDLEPLIKKFAAEVPEQLVWGSDWPHTGMGKERIGRSIDVPEPFQEIDDVAVLRQLRHWIEEKTWEKIMVLNPARIYEGISLK
jgi:predicted TIM-barrel fold metal-dependent hydrolase